MSTRTGARSKAKPASRDAFRIGTPASVEGEAYLGDVHVCLTGALGITTHMQWRIIEVAIESMRRQYAPARLEVKLAFVFKAFSEPWQPSENLQGIMKFGRVKRNALHEACARLGMPHDGLVILINGR